MKGNPKPHASKWAKYNGDHSGKGDKKIKDHHRSTKKTKPMDSHRKTSAY